MSRDVIQLPVWVEHRRKCCPACDRPTARGTVAKSGKVLLTSECDGRTIREIYEDPDQPCPLKKFNRPLGGEAGRIVVSGGVIAGWIEGRATVEPSPSTNGQRRGGCGSC